jgi:hypothetical protein
MVVSVVQYSAQAWEDPQIKVLAGGKGRRKPVRGLFGQRASCAIADRIPSEQHSGRRES